MGKITLDDGTIIEHIEVNQFIIKHTNHNVSFPASFNFLNEFVYDESLAHNFDMTTIQRVISKIFPIQWV
jgi:hypothetical protein